MFDVTKIQDSLYGVVGFRQPLNPDYAILTAANTTSRSGRFVTDNPYVKVEYLKDAQDYKDVADADFNTYLEQLQKSSISQVCGSVFNQTDFIDRQLLYKNANNKITPANLGTGLVCYKIQVSSEKNVAFEIKRVLLEFQGSGTLKLMLFNTAESAPIFQKDIVISTTNHEEQLNWKVDNSGSTYKGDYYLGYRTNDPAMGTLAAFDRDYENADIMSNITHLCFTRLFFNGVTTDTLPDLDADDGLSEDIGVNPDITVYEDYTDLIIQNETLLGKAVYLQLSVLCANVYLSSLRSNRNERESERVIMRIIQQIEGQNQEGAVKITGLRPELSSEIKKIQQEIERIRDGYFTSEMTAHTLD